MNPNRTAFTISTAVAVSVIALGTVASLQETSHADTATHTQVAKPHQWPVTNPPARTRWMKVSCRQEDSTDCSWNAQQQGNGIGHSFYAVTRPLENVHGVKIGRVTCVYYVKMADHHWDACHVRNW